MFLLKIEEGEVGSIRGEIVFARTKTGEDFLGMPRFTWSERPCFGNRKSHAFAKVSLARGENVRRRLDLAVTVFITKTVSPVAMQNDWLRGYTRAKDFNSLATRDLQHVMQASNKDKSPIT